MSMPFETIWTSCNHADWLQWLMNKLGIRHVHGSCEAIRASVPWSVIADTIANPPTEVACDHCDERFPPGDLSDGWCEDCDDERVYCTICDRKHSRDSICDHLEWSNSASDYMGTGGASDDDHRKSLCIVLAHMGLRLARELREAIAVGKLWSYYDDIGEALVCIRDRARDTDDRNDTEIGCIWLNTLEAVEGLRGARETTVRWIDEHLAAREAAIAADRRPRRVIRDGAGRHYVAGLWTAIREDASWMHTRRAARTARALRRMHPEAGIRVVHVLTPAPAPATKGSR